MKQMTLAAAKGFEVHGSELTGFFCTRLNVVFNLEEGVGRWQRRDLARSSQCPHSPK